ncbi:MAG TPA: sugar phosphate isomerase/epimerase family protein [Pedobacter sp.]|jgi:sugar phosphate isomerase/epimerase
MCPKKLFFVLYLFFFWTLAVNAQQLPTLGIAGGLNHDSLFYASGFRVTGTSVSYLISPSISKEQFEANLKQIRAAKCKVFMCNVLFPGRIKIAGPDVNEEKVLQYLDSVLKRAEQAGIKNLILGSGGPRRLPDNYDLVKAKKHFAALARKMAMAAKRHRVRIIFENLNSKETNFINTLKDAAEIVRSVNHPNFKLNADIYHMMNENESPDAILKAGKLIVYCEVAEKEKRTFPGVTGDDFKPYFRALKAIRFKGPIMIEGNSKDLNKEVPQAFNYLSTQLREVYQN